MQNIARAARRETSGKLKQLLKDLLGEDAKKAIEAAEALSEMGFAAQPAAAGLAAMLHDATPPAALPRPRPWASSAWPRPTSCPR